jgi:hypothetical protein
MGFVRFFAPLLIGLSLPGFAEYVETDNEATVRANCHTVQRALEKHAKAHGGEYPSANWADELRSDLPGCQIPDVPYGDRRVFQGTALSPADGALHDAGDPRGPSRVGTVVGPGKAPSTMAFDAMTYGAILYGVDAQRRTYVVYGIAQRGQQAVVACALTNARRR